MFRKLFASNELKAVIGVLDETAYRCSDNRACQSICSSVESQLLKDSRTVEEALQDGVSPREYAYTMLANSAGDELATGKYYMYGAVDRLGVGEDLLKLFDSVIDELVHMGVLAHKQAQYNKRAVREWPPGSGRAIVERQSIPTKVKHLLDCIASIMSGKSPCSFREKILKAVSDEIQMVDDSIKDICKILNGSVLEIDKLMDVATGVSSSSLSDPETLDRVDIENMSLDEAIGLWINLQDFGLYEWMNKQGFDMQTLVEIEDLLLTNDLMAYGKWLLEEFYPKWQCEVNRCYSEFMGFELSLANRIPQRRLYSGNEHFTSGVTRYYRYSRRRCEAKEGAFDVAFSFLQEVAHFCSWSEVAYELIHVLKHKDTKAVIIERHGESAFKKLAAAIDSAILFDHTKNRDLWRELRNMAT